MTFEVVDEKPYFSINQTAKPASSNAPKKLVTHRNVNNGFRIASLLCFAMTDKVVFHVIQP